MGRNSVRKIFFVLFILATLMIMPSLAQTPAPPQVDLGNVKGTVVTLYYYNFETGGKDGIVPLPDDQNPQEVEWDYTKSAPGTYTFYRVPFGIYYLEAVHGNNSYFAIVNVTAGTATANVAIPPNATEWTLVATPSPVPSPTPTAVPSPSPTPLPTPSPGMTSLCALAGLMIVTLYVALRKNK
jgi:hypothetical protein